MGIRDIFVNPLGFGTAPLGNLFRDIPDQEAVATVDAAWEHGTRFSTRHRCMAPGDGRAVLQHGQREDVSLVEDLSDKRAAILRRYLDLAAGARPFFAIERSAPLSEFERIVDQYPVFRVA
jgi:hypothetical protein